MAHIDVTQLIIGGEMFDCLFKWKTSQLILSNMWTGKSNTIRETLTYILPEENQWLVRQCFGTKSDVGSSLAADQLLRWNTCTPMARPVHNWASLWTPGARGTSGHCVAIYWTPNAASRVLAAIVDSKSYYYFPVNRFSLYLEMKVILSGKEKNDLIPCHFNQNE